MEYFANDPRVLRSFGQHYKTGETIPDEYIDILVKSKAVFAASELQSQVSSTATRFCEIV